MKYTNIKNLDDIAYNVLCHDNYDGYKHKENHFCSVTDLLNPTMVTYLKERHKDNIEIDISERMWLHMGNAFHNYCESILQKSSNMIPEKRVTIKIADKEISGGVDLFDVKNKILYDIKLTSVWTLKFLDPSDEHNRFHDWLLQTNLYSIGYEQAGFEVNKIKIWAVLRDWNQNEAFRNADYAQASSSFIEMPKLPFEDVEKVVRQKAEKLELARKTGNVEPCTLGERWAKKTTFAIKKKNRKSAVKANIESWDLANQLLPKYGKDHYIETRNGEDTRCLRYCEVSKFCPYYKEKYANNETSSFTE
jgi:hypothetical protein